MPVQYGLVPSRCQGVLPLYIRRCGLDSVHGGVQTKLGVDVPVGLWYYGAMEDKKVDLHIRLDPELHEEVRRLAYEQRRSINSMILEAIAGLLMAHADKSSEEKNK